MTNYSQESDVYEATGIKSEVVQKLSGKTSEQVTTLITNYIKQGDQVIKRLLGVPITVRKEYHGFNGNVTIELGPSEDEFEFYADYDPANCVEAIYAIYNSAGRAKLPYPKNCDSLTEEMTDFNYTFTPVATTKRARASNIATITTGLAHGLVIGNGVTINGLGGIGYNGSFIILTVPDTTHFTYASTGTDESEVGDTGGTVICTVTKETSIKKCGTASIKAIFTGAGSFDFPKDHYLNKNIEPWEFIGFWFRTTDKTAIFTISLYDFDGNKISTTFQCTVSDTWQIIALEIDEFTGDYTFDENRFLQYIKIESDKACTVYFDNFNFNDGYFWTYPEGLICWCDPDILDPSSAIKVTYSYDPFKITTPEDVKMASAKKAGILLLEYLIGCRQRVTAFIQTSENLDQYPDRETLEFTKARLEREIVEILAGIGFKTYSGLGTA